MSKDMLLAIIGLMAIVCYSVVLYQAFFNHHKLCGWVVCIIIATAFVDYRHKQKDTLINGFVRGLYGEEGANHDE